MPALVHTVRLVVLRRFTSLRLHDRLWYSLLCYNLSRSPGPTLAGGPRTRSLDCGCRCASWEIRTTRRRGVPSTEKPSLSSCSCFSRPAQVPLRSAQRCMGLPFTLYTGLTVRLHTRCRTQGLTWEGCLKLLHSAVHIPRRELFAAQLQDKVLCLHDLVRVLSRLSILHAALYMQQAGCQLQEHFVGVRDCMHLSTAQD